MEKIIETKVCKWTWEKFNIYEKDLEILEKLSPVIWWQKFLLPTPNLSPKAREINRLMFRNERNFYKIKTENWKSEISTIHPDMRKRIIDIENFNNYDFTKEWIDYTWNFLEDFRKLILKSPNQSRLIANMENSPYCNQEANNKNCYLNAWWFENEDSMYNTFATVSKDVVDNYWVFNSSIVYDSINIFSSSKVFFSTEVKDSYNCYFSYDLVWCQNVIFWSSLENKNYVFKNEVLSKEKWEEKYKEFKDKLKTRKWLNELKKEFEDFLKKAWKKEVFIESSENTYWNIIINSKSSFEVLYWNKNENIRYANIVWEVNDSMDINSFAYWDKVYNCASSGFVKSSISSSHIIYSDNIFYSFWVDSINHAFWCLWFWLKNKSYLILNKKYEKEEWEKIVQKIILELQEKWLWWKFLSPDLSPFPYNDTVAMEYYPIKKIMILEWNNIVSEKINSEDGIWTVYILEKDKFISKAIIDFWWVEKIHTYWRTKEIEVDIPKNMEKILWNEIPEIDTIDESILNKAIICEKSKRPFRIVKKELEFYKKYSLPIPSLHYNERHLNRIKMKSNNYYFVE